MCDRQHLGMKYESETVDIKRRDKSLFNIMVLLLVVGVLRLLDIAFFVWSHVGRSSDGDGLQMGVLNVGEDDC